MKLSFKKILKNLITQFFFPFHTVGLSSHLGQGKGNRQQTEGLNLASAADHEGRGVLSSAREKTALLAKTKFLLISLQMSCIPSF